MGQTDIYKLRWPERTGVPADGPDGYKDLAQDTEDQMIRMRERINYTPSSFPAKAVNPGQTATLFDVTLDSKIPGWVQIEIHGQIYFGIYSNFSGMITATVTKGGYTVVERKFRWLGSGAGLNSLMMGRLAVPTIDLAPQRFVLKAFVDSASAGTVHHNRWSYCFQTYGGKKVGT